MRVRRAQNCKLDLLSVDGNEASRLERPAPGSRWALKALYPPDLPLGGDARADRGAAQAHVPGVTIGVRQATVVAAVRAALPGLAVPVRSGVAVGVDVTAVLGAKTLDAYFERVEAA